MAGMMEEMQMEKRVSSLLTSAKQIKHFRLEGENLVHHAARLSALKKLVVYNEHKKTTEGKFEYELDVVKNSEGILKTIKRLAEETKQEETILKKDYAEYLRGYTEDKLKEKVLELLTS